MYHLHSTSRGLKIDGSVRLSGRLLRYIGWMGAKESQLRYLEQAKPQIFSISRLKPSKVHFSGKF